LRTSKKTKFYKNYQLENRKPKTRPQNEAKTIDQLDKKGAAGASQVERSLEQNECPYECPHKGESAVRPRGIRVRPGERECPDDRECPLNRETVSVQERDRVRVRAIALYQNIRKEIRCLPIFAEVSVYIY